MEDLSPEDRDFLEAVAGRRPGTPLEEALRSSLLQFARDSHEAAEQSKLPPTVDEVKSLESLRQALIDAGALPALDIVSDGPKPQIVRSKKSTSLLDTLYGLFGGGARGGGAGSAASASWWVPAGALALGAIALMVILSPKVGQNGPVGPEATRGSGTSVKATDPASKCAEIVAKLVQAGISKDWITESSPQNSCTIAVRTNELALQAEVAKVFREAGAVVPLSGLMELTVTAGR